MTADPFKTINGLTGALVELNLITDDGDRDETDARIWAALNVLREELQNALHA